MHVLITGPRGVGKSTLVRRVLAELNTPVFGFETKKEPALADPARGTPVYIYEAGAPRRRTEENLVGYCENRRAAAVKESFDRWAARLRAPVPEGHLVLMDELGFLESSSPDFCAAVLERLDGNVPVLATVKDKNTPFLEAVRAHPRGKCFFITEENRDALFEEVLAFLREQLRGEGQ